MTRMTRLRPPPKVPTMRPSDIYVGIVDLMGVLLPGLVLAFWSLPLFAQLPAEYLAPEGLGDARALLVAVAALFLGHVAYGLGSGLEMLLGALGRRYRGKQAASAEMHGERKAERTEREGALARDALIRAGHTREWEGEPSKSYCTMVLVRENADVASRVERVYALVRFFRTFAAVFLVFLLAGVPPTMRFALGWEGRVPLFLAVVLLFVVSLLGYRIYRDMHARWLYRAIVAVLARSQEGE